MAQRQRIDLLDHPRRSLAPHLRRLGRTPRVLVRLLLVEDLFLLPTLMIKNDQLFRRIDFFVQKIGNQHMLLAMADALRVVERVAEHADHDPVAVLLPVVRALVNLGQVRAIGQVAERRKINPLLTRASTFTECAVICFHTS